MQDGRYAFRGKKHLLLPLLFLLPQLAITVVFFFYPAGEALMGSFSQLILLYYTAQDLSTLFYKTERHMGDFISKEEN